MLIKNALELLLKTHNLHENFWILASFSNVTDGLLKIKEKNTKNKYLVYSIQIIPYTTLSIASVTRLKHYNLPFINIIQIKDYFKTQEGAPIIWEYTDDSTDKNWIRIAQYSYPNFFNEELLDQFFRSEELDRTYFLFHSSVWAIILTYFRYNNYILSQGSTKIRGICSEVHRRTSRFLDLYQLDNVRGYHGKLSPILKEKIDFTSTLGKEKYEEIATLIKKDFEAPSSTINTSPFSINGQIRKFHSSLPILSKIYPKSHGLDLDWDKFEYKLLDKKLTQEEIEKVIKAFYESVFIVDTSPESVLVKFNLRLIGGIEKDISFIFKFDWLQEYYWLIVLFNGFLSLQKDLYNITHIILKYKPISREESEDDIITYNYKDTYKYYLGEEISDFNRDLNYVPYKPKDEDNWEEDSVFIEDGILTEDYAHVIISSFYHKFDWNNKIGTLSLIQFKVLTNNEWIDLSFVMCYGRTSERELLYLFFEFVSLKKDLLLNPDGTMKIDMILFRYNLKPTNKHLNNFHADRNIFISKSKSGIRKFSTSSINRAFIPNKEIETNPSNPFWKFYEYRLADNILRYDCLLESINNFYVEVMSDLSPNNTLIVSFILRISDYRQQDISFLLKFNRWDIEKMYTLLIGFYILKDQLLSSITDSNGNIRASGIIYKYLTSPTSDLLFNLGRKQINYPADIDLENISLSQNVKNELDNDPTWNYYSHILIDSKLDYPDLGIALKDFINFVSTDSKDNPELHFQLRVKTINGEFIDISLVFKYNIDKLNYVELYSLFCKFLSLKERLLTIKNNGMKADEIIFRYKYIEISYSDINSVQEDKNNISKNHLTIDDSNIDWKEFIFSIEMVEKFVDNPIELAMEKFNESIKVEVEDKVLWIKNFKIKTKTGEIKLEKDVSKDDVITHVIITYTIKDVEGFKDKIVDPKKAPEDSLIDNWDKFTFKIDFDYDSIDSIMSLAFDKLNEYLKPQSDEDVANDKVAVLKNIKLVTRNGIEIEPDKITPNDETEVTHVVITYKITSLASVIRKEYERSNKPSNGDKKEYHTLTCLNSNSSKLCDRIPSSVYNINNLTPHNRKISSTSQVLSNKKLKTKSLQDKSLMFNYLNTVKNIINNPEYTPEKAQEIIETSWVKIMEDHIRESKDIIKKEYNKLGKLLLEAEKTLDLYFKHKTLKRKFPKFNDELNKLDHILIAFSCGISFYSYLHFNTIAVMTGKNIIYSIYKNRKHLSKDEDFPTFTKWKLIEELDDDAELGKIGYFFLSILSNLPANIFERTLDREDGSEFYSPSQLKINDDIIDEIRENMVIHPSTLPMICKPVEWNNDSFGGFIDNKNKGEGVITKPFVHKHKMENLEPLYNVINYLNSIQFSINESLINFINGEGSYLLTEIKPEDELQQSITIKLAETFINKILYFNVKADWRGRIYTESFFLDYQGSDLASALLNFVDGEPLTELGREYLYIYGANNHNQKNISKETFKKRVDWVNKNYNKIISLDKKLILSAENPFIFTAFCLTVRELHNNPNAMIKLPVFLDATCNGMQHLAAMLKDLELGGKVNLTSFNINEKPKDFYSEVIVSINKAINQYGKENKQYAHFQLLELTRLILKLSIMTKVYNVTKIGITDQVRSKLGKTKLDPENIGSIEHINLELKQLIRSGKPRKIDKDGEDKKYSKTFFIAPGKNGEKIHLTSHDIYKIAVIVNDVIFELYPSLKKIYDYLINISKLMIKLDIPLTWITPSGMKITQHYLISKRRTIPIQFAGHVSKMVLKERTDKLSVNKQIGSIIPNTIHSLDSTHLIKLVLTAKTDNFSPLISVHDCFGTHPNKMGELGFRVKKEFILLYTQENFLETFHCRIIQSILDNKFKIIDGNNEKFVILENSINKKLPIPSLPELGKLELEKIIDAKYMIN